MKFALLTLVWVLPFATMAQKPTDSASARSAKISVRRLDTATVEKAKNDTIRLSLKDSALATLPLPIDSTIILLVKNEEAEEGSLYKVWLPLIALVVGAVLTLLAEWIKRWFAIRKAGRRWIGLSKIYIPAIAMQEELIENFLAEEDPDKYDMAALDRVPSIDGEQFSAYSKEELLSYLELHKHNSPEDALDELSKLTGTLSALKFNYQQLDNSYKLYETAISRHSFEATELLRKIGAALGDWTREIEIRGFVEGEEPAYNNAIDLYQEQVLNKAGKNNWDIFELEVNLYDPMIERLAAGFAIESVYKVLKSIELAKYAIPQIKAEKHYMVNAAKTVLDRYKSYRTELVNAIEQIEGSKK